MSATIDQTLADLLEGVPSLPPVAARILSLTTREDCSLDELADVIICDAPMALRFMALANSAALHPGLPVRTVRQALVRLGLRRTRDIALLMGMHDLVPSSGSYADLAAEDYWRNTLAVAATAGALGRSDPGADPDDCWLAGLFLGLGVPLLGRQSPRGLVRARELAVAETLPLAEAVRLTLGIAPSELVASLLERWEFPSHLIASVQGGPAVPARILRAAHDFVRHLGYGVCGDEDPAPTAPDLNRILAGWDREITSLAREVGRLVRDTAALIDLDLSPSDLGPVLDQMRQVAVRIGLQGLEDARVRGELEQDTRHARRIQRRLLPATLPDLPGYSLAAENIPGRRVSGDFYDFSRCPGGELLLMIADIAGDGLPAALLAGNVQACTRTLARTVGDPGSLLAALNQTLFESTPEEAFATMFLARLDPATGELIFAGAGHPPALLAGPDGATRWFTAVAPPLGLLPGTRYPEVRTTLGPGSRLVLYTDGITEITDARGREFGRENLARIATDHHEVAPAEICRALLRAALSHARGAAPKASPSGDRDDMTLLILGREISR